MEVNNHPYREHVLSKLDDLHAFRTHIELINCEKSIFNKSIQDFQNIHKLDPKWKCPVFKGIYKQNFMKVHFNIKNPKNSSIVDRIQKKELRPQDIVFAEHKTLWPEHWYGCEPGKFIIIESTKDMFKDGQESLLSCGRCKSHKVHYFEMQTRSADEPMTAFCTCMNCGNKWKM